MYNSSSIADRIKATAKLRNISIKSLLENVGLGFNTMSNMKTSMPKADNLAKIADYLDCSVDYLLGRTDNPEVNR
ncbi:MAG: helix-turn-helix transcriptional regulator [Anaerotignum sp.]|jgi:transcriptional regulator with XRE-family HTH domain|nr:helix-turn-helix transcriptional regulator [Anaerotignum sp.]